MSNLLLDKLGIRSEVQSFFAPYHHDLRFKYGDDCEHFSLLFHRVPITENVWIAGIPELASDIFICGSAMDAIAFNRVSDHYAFIAIGALPSAQQLDPLLKRRFHLLFTNDFLGSACDIKVACWLRQQPVTIRLVEQHYEIKLRNQIYHLKCLSLHALEKASGYRFGIRTHKPKNSLTWISSLSHRLFSPF